MEKHNYVNFGSHNLIVKLLVNTNLMSVCVCVCVCVCVGLGHDVCRRVWEGEYPHTG